MSMKIGIIDIGTNSMLLLVFEDGKEVLDISEIVRLGEGVKENGVIRKQAIKRALSTLHTFKSSYLMDADEVIVFGTEVLRKAKNAGEFITLVKEKFGFDVKILSPYEEAFFSYLSVKYDDMIPLEEFLIFDIGGGSTEVIRGTRTKFEGYVSLPIGCVNLTETFIKHDPPKESELFLLGRSIEDTIQRDLGEFQGKGFIVGIGGTVTTLACIIDGVHEFKKNSIHGKKIGLSELKEAIERIRPLRREERLKIKGMEKKRADILLAGLLLLEKLLFFFGVEEIQVSTYGARYGVLYERMGHG